MNKEALELYDCFHLLIPKGGDERDVQVYSHSQGDWNILKRKAGILWTLPISLLRGRYKHGRTTTHFDPDKTPLDTAYDLWQLATGLGCMGVRVDG